MKNAALFCWEPDLRTDAQVRADLVKERDNQLRKLGFERSGPPSLNDDWRGDLSSQRFYRLRHGAAICHCGFDTVSLACILTTSGLGRTFTDWLGNLVDGHTLFGKMRAMGWIDSGPVLP